jgi:hypothetical protein
MIYSGSGSYFLDLTRKFRIRIHNTGIKNAKKECRFRATCDLTQVNAYLNPVQCRE